MNQENFEGKRLICILPIFKRSEITKLAIKYLQNQTIPFYKIIVVGTVKEDETLATECGVEYVHQHNDYLSKKYQKGINKARTYNPDAIMIANSDELVESTWNATFLKNITRADIFGPKQHMVLDLSTATLYKVVHFADMPLADSAKWITSDYLDKVDWQLYNTSIRSDCINTMHIKLLTNHAVITTLSGKILSLKGAWKVIHSLDQVLATTASRVQKLSYSRKFLERNFSDVIDLLPVLDTVEEAEEKDEKINEDDFEDLPLGENFGSDHSVF